MASVPGVVPSGNKWVGAGVARGAGVLVSGAGRGIWVVGITVPVVGVVVAGVPVVSVGSSVSLLQAQAHREKAKASTNAKMTIFFISILLFSDFNSSISFASLLRQEKSVIPVKIISINH